MAAEKHLCKDRAPAMGSFTAWLRRKAFPCEKIASTGLVPSVWFGSDPLLMLKGGSLWVRVDRRGFMKDLNKQKGNLLEEYWIPAGSSGATQHYAHNWSPKATPAATARYGY